MDEFHLLSALQDALQGNDLSVMIEAGEKLIASGIDIDDETRKSISKVMGTYAIIQRLRRAIQQNDDESIVEIWRMNYDRIVRFVQLEENIRVQIALQRIHNLPRIRAAFRKKDASEFIRLYDPLIYENNALLDETEHQYYQVALEQVRLLRELKAAAENDDLRMLFLLYPEDQESIEPLLNDSIREKIFLARKNMRNVIK